MVFPNTGFLAALTLAQATLPLGVLAAPSSSTLQACAKIAALLPSGRVHYPQNLVEYNAERSAYWSTASRALEPACIVVPQNAEHVSAAIMTLLRFPSVNFAVRSGGHDPNVEHASVQDDVLIAMTALAGVRYDAATGLAHVKPGGEWNDVIGELEKSGVAIAGGRLGLVGIAGLLLQGGLSFLSAQHGLAADSIIGWETIAANGSIINIDATQHPDLTVAMRGSGSQFGIVTEFKVKARPIGKVWGGIRIYNASQETELYAALHKFVANGASDPKAAIIHSSIVFSGIQSHVVFYFYDGPSPPTEGVLAEYLRISSTLDTTKARSYSDLLKSNGEPVAPLNARQSFRTYTLPFIPSNPAVYVLTRDKFTQIAQPFLARTTSQFTVDFQPLPSAVGAHSELAGGNAMGLRGGDPDRTILVLHGSWEFASDDDAGHAIAREVSEWLDAMVPEWLGQAGMNSTGLYMPLFMNDGAWDQNVTGSYGDYARFKALQEQMDPQQVFAQRLGGFKY
ncbi:uncharacterized protein B0I36DRAFT_246204 [Microdochium trichocladiopsis]|uniref:FAD-binding PCMH-type domain-containing protein n=1 Tax=Microdochium trichocladiopsis TaxID=1682393 RepID=A0A9P8Y7D6_9PEZI|nr:uncharacterized protein B0I36DRAFT_246204 [Microdochium trichocladiopsis]KAH7029743.1 hypothetical protein B0I36DRAFT_246204 [Microdochium trichocladiopsis]